MRNILFVMLFLFAFIYGQQYDDVYSNDNIQQYDDIQSNDNEQQYDDVYSNDNEQQYDEVIQTNNNVHTNNIVNITNNNGISVLYEAIDNNNIEYIKELIINGINLNVRLPDNYTNNLSGATPLLYSIYKNNTDITRLLIENGANLNIKDFKTWNSIMYAAAFSDINTLVMLIEKDETLINSKTEFHVNPLHIASDHNNLEAIMYLCTNSNIDINERDIDGWTSLYHAANSKSIEAYNLLIRLGADTNIGDNDNVLPSTVLERKIEHENNQFREIDNNLLKAIETNGIKTMRNLIRAGANVNTKDGYGLSALHFAIKNNNLDAVKILLGNRNINLEAELPEGYFTHLVNEQADAIYIGRATPLLYAILKSNGDSRIVNMLIKKGANVNARDEESWSAFLYAAAFGNPDILGSLYYKNRKLINTKTKDNATALHMAVVYDNLENIKYLVEKLNINIDAQDDDGWTALYYAAINNKKDAYKLLLKLGADKNIANNEGLKPADVLQ
ncbi:ankyrin repeat domain-containing protein [Brachyspira alvinipulli]|uniref:ankyrin repeat domain-containing protein n=1 Tax=Brachyspira alvinipulli TaxID=84379 RepID=UPI000485D40C|nr:ankyrin repeat domain-containing protein [Brachyspira alvinipulli]